MLNTSESGESREKAKYAAFFMAHSRHEPATELSRTTFLKLAKVIHGLA